MWNLGGDRLEPQATSIASLYACRGADACYIAVASIANDVLWTFDKTQKDVARKAARVGEP